MTSVTQTTDVAAPSASRRRLISLGVRAVVILGIAGRLASGVVSRWPWVQRSWLGLAWQSVVLAVLAALAGMFANSMAWRAAARDLEHTVSVPAALRILMVGQLGKYIPGSIWAYVLQMELGRRAGLPRARSFLATLVTVGLGVVSALGLGVLSLPQLLDVANADVDYARPVRIALIIAAALFPVAVVCAIPAVLTRLIRLALRILRRPPLHHRLTAAGVRRVIAWSVLGYTLFGIHLWLLANAQAAPGVGGLVRCVGLFAIAMTVGMFAFLSPSGLGVREAVLVATLAPFLTSAGGVGAALLIALASRLIFTLADLMGAGLAALSGTRLLQRTSPPTSDAEAGAAASRTNAVTVPASSRALPDA